MTPAEQLAAVRESLAISRERHAKAVEHNAAVRMALEQSSLLVRAWEMDVRVLEEQEREILAAWAREPDYDPAPDAEQQWDRDVSAAIDAGEVDYDPDTPAGRIAEHTGRTEYL